MWHDDPGDERGDDGRDEWRDEVDDDPEAGPLPDPSARHWRHPSELRHQHALPTPPPAPVPVGSTTAPGSPVWPALAVGGVLAVATIGVLGLQAAFQGPGSLEADGGVTTAPSTPAVGAAMAPVVNLESTTTVTSPPTTALGPTTSTAFELGAPRDPIPFSTTSTVLLRPAPSVAAENARAYGVYAERGAEESRLASFVAVDGEVVTSAAAIGDQETVWLRVERDWLQAWVVGVDPLTDVALLDVQWLDGADAGAEVEVELPWLELASTPFEPGRPAMIGYGSVDEPGSNDRIEALASAGDTGIGPSVEDGNGTDDEATDDDGPSDDVERADDGAAGQDETEDGPPDQDQAQDPDGGDDRLGDPADDPTDRNTGADPVADDERGTATPPTAESDDDQQTAATDQRPAGSSATTERDWTDDSERRGLIYSVTMPQRTRTNRIVHESIMALIEPLDGDGGAPLRNRSGEVIGMTISGTGSQVAAVPIERVLASVRSLRALGAGDPAWLGVEVQPAVDQRGLLVGLVDDRGPIESLATGDVIVAVSGQPAAHPDVLGYAARQAGPGGRLQLTLDRDRRRLTIEVEVGTYPATP